MTRRQLLAASALAALALVGCAPGSNTRGVRIDYGQSSVYSGRDMDEAILLIRMKFETWRGCTLHTLTYAGDEYSAESLDRCNEQVDDADFAECIVFGSTFHSPKDGGGIWNDDFEYTDWNWYLARAQGGHWRMVTWGCC